MRLPTDTYREMITMTKKIPAPELARIERGTPRKPDRYVLIVNGGLRFIRGNKLPYFFLTCSGWDDRSDFGGAAHEDILREFPEFADLAALHLSDINGVPTHALENGFYWLAGGYYLGLRWHSPKETWEQRRRNLVRHFRIPEQVIDDEILPLLGDHFSIHAGFLGKGAEAEAKARVAEWVEAQKPRWQSEAMACVDRHDLIVFGDHWEAPGEREIITEGNQP